MPVMTTLEYAEYLRETAIEKTLCAGRGNYRKWDTRLASQKAKDAKQQASITHCPSDAESFGEPASDDHLIDWTNIGCADEIAQEYDPSLDECDE